VSQSRERIRSYSDPPPEWCPPWRLVGARTREWAFTCSGLTAFDFTHVTASDGLPEFDAIHIAAATAPTEERGLQRMELWAIHLSEIEHAWATPLLHPLRVLVLHLCWESDSTACGAWRQILRSCPHLHSLQRSRRVHQVRTAPRCGDRSLQVISVDTLIHAHETNGLGRMARARSIRRSSARRSCHAQRIVFGVD